MKNAGNGKVNQMNRKFNTVNLRQVSLKDAYCVNALEKEIAYLLEFDADKLIKEHLTQFAKDTKKEISDHMKETYNKELQSTLCDSIVDIIMQNKEFKNINDNIKRLGE